MINEAKSRFEENEFIYAFWGLLGAIAAFGQFFLLKNGYGNINYYPCFLMPLGAIKNWLILYSGVIINFAGIVCFRLEWIYQPLLLGVVFVVAMFIPGIILMAEHKRRENV